MRLAAWLSGALMMLGAGPAGAQVAPYQVFQQTEPYVGLGPSAQEILPGLGDASTYAVPLPFSVVLYGEEFTTVFINANGVVSVTSGRAGLNFSPGTMPSASTPNGFVAPLWDDWCSSVAGCPGATQPGAGVFYEVDDTPGQGKISVEWRRIRHFTDTQAPSDVTFMMTWHEGPAAQLDIRFGPASPGVNFLGNPTEIQARVGLESANGALGMWIAPCGGPQPCSTLDVGNLEDLLVTVLADAGQDVTVTNLSTPEVGYPGLPLAVSARLVSRHQNPLGPLRYAAWLVPAANTSTVGVAPLLVSAPLTLEGFESRALDLELEVPAGLAAGQYRVALVADVGDDLAETDELNNLALSAPVRIAEQAPDFRVTRLQPLSTEVRPGAPLQVAYAAENAGNRPGALELRVVLSDNRAITTSDVELGSVTFDTAPRQTVTGTLTAVVPASLQTGLYYVGALVDPELRVAELDEGNNDARTAQPVVVASDEVQILTESLPPAVLGRPYSATVEAAGGDGRYRFELVGGFIPRGLGLDASTGVIAGVPLQATQVTLELEATSGGASGTRALELAILEPNLPLTPVTRHLPEAVVGHDYAARLYAAGGVWPYGWSVDAGALAPGLGLSVDGDIFGVPGAVGAFPVVLRVRDNAGATATVAVSLDVRAAPNLTVVSRDLPRAQLLETYVHPLQAQGGLPPYSWRRLTTPPPGLTVSTDGSLQGLPEQVGRFRMLVEVRDRLGHVDTAEVVLEVTQTGRFAISTQALPEGAPQTEYHVVLRADGGDRPYTWALPWEEGRLPASFEVAPGAGEAGESADDLVIRGQLEREGRWAFTARVTDARGRTDERAFVVISRVPDPDPAAAEPGGCTCHLGGGAPRPDLILLVGGVWVLLGLRRRSRSLKRAL
ncbi:MAG: hypothetical protein KC933_00250 [Myxococcales bacterium]|nr:hypothetical protein [Myxococcales bacterium]